MTYAVEVSNISKSFGKVKAVEDVSFTVERGEIFGLLGPNGAGKTTIIRLVLDIFKPDHGQVAVLGSKMSEATKDFIGYMPEERGLYQDIGLERVLTYMAELKGIQPRIARQRVLDYLERFELIDYRRKKIRELSKGMQQKAQIIATLVHQPELIIVDEPFSGLDPVNTQMVIRLLRDLHQGGATIIMSTHQLHNVEELCDRILLINRGSTLLYGKLESIRKDFSGNAILVKSADVLPSLPGIQAIEPHNSNMRITLTPGTNPQQFLQALIEHQIILEKFEIAIPTLDEIFVKAIDTDQNPDA